MKLLAFYNKRGVELSYSALMFLSGNPSWFCRIWVGRERKESYGKTKYDAYRRALKARPIY